MTTTDDARTSSTVTGKASAQPGSLAADLTSARTPLALLFPGIDGSWPHALAETLVGRPGLSAWVDAVVADILAGLSERDKETLRRTKREDLIRFHHGWGTGIRNYYGLWRGNKELLRSACGREPCHPDDASMVIIERVWEAVQDPIDKQAEQRSSSK